MGRRDVTWAPTWQPECQELGNISIHSLTDSPDTALSHLSFLSYGLLDIPEKPVASWEEGDRLQGELHVLTSDCKDVSVGVVILERVEHRGPWWREKAWEFAGF